jgi:tRNA splicing endonuclease
MLIEAKPSSGAQYFETDPLLCQKFLEAGFGAMEGGKLALSALEACFLAKIGKADFSKGGIEGAVSRQSRKDKEFEFAFAVYFAIRGTGRLVLPAKGAKGYFRVFAPGVGRAEERPSLLLRLLPGKKPTADVLKNEVRLAHLERLDLVVATGTAAEPKFHKISAFNF